MHRVFLLPGRRLHFLEARADDHLHVLAAEPARGAAAVHGGVAAAQHDHPSADLVDMAERDAGEPVDTDVDVGLGLLTARNIELAAARGAGADEHRVIALGQQALKALNPLAGAHGHAEAGDVVHLLVDHRFRQPEARDLAPDHAAGLRIGVDDGQLIAQRGQVAGDGQRGRPGADQRHALAVAVGRRLRQPGGDVGLVVGGDALQAADRHRLVLHAPPAAGRLARPVARPPENPREDIGLPVDHIGVGVSPFSDEPDVLWHRRMSRARPLAINDLVEVIWRLGVRRLQSKTLCCLPDGPVLRSHGAANFSRRLVGAGWIATLLVRPHSPGQRDMGIDGRLWAAHHGLHRLDAVSHCAAISVYCQVVALCHSGVGLELQHWAVVRGSAD